MSKKIKPLYEFVIEKTEKAEEKTDNNDGTFTIKEVTKKIPHKFCLKTPSRQDRDHAELFYYRQMNEASKQGLVPEAILIKRLNDNGGLISEADKKLLIEHQAKIEDKKTDITEAEKTPEDAEKIAKLKEELASLSDDLQTYSNTYGKLELSVLDTSAESWVRNKLVRYYLINLLHKDNAGNWMIWGKS